MRGEDGYVEGVVLEDMEISEVLGGGEEEGGEWTDVFADYAETGYGWYCGHFCECYVGILEEMWWFDVNLRLRPSRDFEVGSALQPRLPQYKGTIAGITNNE